MNEQHELYENARKRVKQKKRLYIHFIIFIVGSIYLIFLNKYLKIDESLFTNWFIWVILLWLFFLILHAINVFITHRFMSNDWERKQTEKLVLKQEIKIAKLEKEITKEAKLNAESEQSASEFKKKENF
ncbi:2TM domain-containing protein [Lutibacter sp.]|uniref:2TM domain-containing protein n=1 Tax=Lutibacter sp. TaxID=1925666 RepID=UPI0035684E7F